MEGEVTQGIVIHQLFLKDPKTGVDNNLSENSFSTLKNTFRHMHGLNKDLMQGWIDLFSFQRACKVIGRNPLVVFLSLLESSKGEEYMRKT